MQTRDCGASQKKHDRISIYVTGGKIRVYGGNKGAREFSCGQRDLCRLSEAQPQAGNSME